MHSPRTCAMPVERPPMACSASGAAPHPPARKRIRSRSPPAKPTTACSRRCGSSPPTSTPTCWPSRQRGVYPIDRLGRAVRRAARRFFQRGDGPNAGLCRVKPGAAGAGHVPPAQPAGAGLPAARRPFNAVFCRNVMIYFDKPTQHRGIASDHPTMAPDGLLFAGHSESFSHAQDVVASCGRTIYRAAPPSMGAAR